MKPGPRGLEPARKTEQEMRGLVVRLHAKMARATTPCGMLPGPRGMNPSRRRRSLARGPLVAHASLSRPRSRVA
eukprot:1968383-Karenia_brevis.AAC.1